MAKELKPRSHPVKKGETIQTIAKKYGFKDWKDVWKHPGNKQLNKTKKDGKGLAPGDTVTVPALNEKEREERREKLRTLTPQYANANILSAQLVLAGQALSEEARALDKRAVTIGAEYDALKNEINDAASSIKKKATGADIVGKFATILVSANVFYKDAKKAGLSLKKHAADKLAKLKHPAAKIIGGGATTTLGFDGAKNILEAFGVLDKDHVDEIEIMTKELGRLYYNVTAPSFYGQAGATLIKGGTWSEAMTADVQRDLKSAIAKIDKDKKASIALITATAAKTRKRAAKTNANAAKVRKAADGLKKQLDDR